MALKIVAGLLLLLLLLLLLRVGVVVDFGETLCVRLRVGPFRKTVVPGKKKAAPPSGEAAAEKEAAPKAGKKSRLPKLSFAELRELAGVALGALGKTARKICRRTRIDPLTVQVVFGGSEPAGTAQTYGYACAALWSVMPVLEELFTIPHPSVHLDTDFQADATKAEGTVGISLRIGGLVAIALTLALPLGKWFLRYRRAHRNDPAPRAAEKEAAAPDETEEKTEQLSA